MKRTYLEEDIQLIRHYFPGAKRTTVRTPFDLSPVKQRMPRLLPDHYRASTRPRAQWIGGVLWMS
jgi:hypothetical protein